VAGAAVANGLGVEEFGVGLADGVGVGLADGVGVGVIVVLADGVAVGLTVPGENGGGVAEDPDPEQAETAAEANMIKAAQPTTAKLALRPLPMMFVRIWNIRLGDLSALGKTRKDVKKPPRRRDSGRISRCSATNALAGRYPGRRTQRYRLG
jgi:hypothetical protein